ncbi:hypothetical protein E0Z10_g9661 [Xylaria hypoxylon]|uniref:Uncharacterized protein n=1 Tax=Xylaria hypoxylon TaxID=37992 RepID=A0A4Z0YK89_9PEZI|nr:hypothetical protein E0Z10_g9661 [Xylaria hypoxylon]
MIPYKSEKDTRISDKGRGGQDDLTWDEPLLPGNYSDRNSLASVQPQVLNRIAYTLPIITCMRTDPPTRQPFRAHNFQLLTPNNQFGIQEVPQPAPKLQTTPHSENFQYGYAQVGHGHNVPEVSQSFYNQNDWQTSQVSRRIMPPLFPGRTNHFYGDARDFLPPEQHQSATPTQSPRACPAAPPGRAPFRRSTRLAWEPNRGPLRGRLPGQHSRHDPLNSHAMPLATQNAAGLDLTGSFTVSQREVGPSDHLPLLPNPLMRSFNGEDVVEVPAVETSRGPTAIIMNDNYDIYNSSLLARVADECEKGPYRNTPKAIATYHQFGMADDLFYGGIWKGRFMVNEGSIIEYHNPAQSRPEVEDNKRKDRRMIFVWARDINGETGWCKVIGGNKLVPAMGMKEPPAEFSGVLDLWKYFFNRVPCAPNEDRYAELVAPLFIDRSQAAANENMAILGVAPGGNTTRAAMRIATREEASIPEAMSIPNSIPTVRISPAPSAAVIPTSQPADVNADIVSSAQFTSTTVPPADDATSSMANAYPAHLSTLQDAGVVPGAANTLADTLPFVDTDMTSTATDSHLPYTGPYLDSAMVSNDTATAEPSNFPAWEDMDLDTTVPYSHSSNRLDVALGAPAVSIDPCAPYGVGVAQGTEGYSSFADFVDFEDVTSTMTASNPLVNFNWFSHNSLNSGNPCNSETLFTSGNSANGDHSLDNNMFSSNLFAINNQMVNDRKEETEPAEEEHVDYSLWTIE